MNIHKREGKIHLNSGKKKVNKQKTITIGSTLLTTSETQALSLSQNLMESLSSVIVGVREHSIRKQARQQSAT